MFYTTGPRRMNSSTSGRCDQLHLWPPSATLLADAAALVAVAGGAVTPPTTRHGCNDGGGLYVDKHTINYPFQF
jgi:hypothetical protein